MQKIIQQIFQKSKGILAADESATSICRRFALHNIECNFETRRQYRQLLFTTAEIDKYLSGVILFDETAGQKTNDGINFVDLLVSRGIIPGIKVDQGLIPLAEGSVEKLTQGQEGLENRLISYQKQRLQFTKWRVVFNIGDSLPTERCLEKNTEVLIQYAALSQQHQMVPIIEPEVLADGNHSIDECQKVTQIVLQYIFEKMKFGAVDLSCLILKMNMVNNGLSAGLENKPIEVAEKTMTVIHSVVPENIGGIVFLSGGQDDQSSVGNLRQICRLKADQRNMTFSFSRALHNSALSVWQGRLENVLAAQAEFLNRCKLCSQALVT